MDQLGRAFAHNLRAEQLSVPVRDQLQQAVLDAGDLAAAASSMPTEEISGIA